MKTGTTNTAERIHRAGNALIIASLIILTGIFLFSFSQVSSSVESVQSQLEGRQVLAQRK